MCGRKALVAWMSWPTCSCSQNLSVANLQLETKIIAHVRASNPKILDLWEQNFMNHLRPMRANPKKEEKLS